MIKYTAIWALLTMGIFVFRFLVTREQKLIARPIITGLLSSSVIATVVVVLAYFINNIQGI